MAKQIFYIVAVIVLMIIAFRLMKKVEDVPTHDPYKLPENSFESDEFDLDSEDDDDSDNLISEDETEPEKQ